jgi:hypothetical protein
VMALAAWLHKTQMTVPYFQILFNLMFFKLIRETSDFCFWKYSKRT